MQRLSDIYPTQVISSDPDWEHGKPKSCTTPSATDGTPYGHAIVKDLIGPLYAILKAADVTPSGVAEKPTSSQVLTSLMAMFARKQDTFSTPGSYSWGGKASWAQWIRVTVVGAGGTPDGGADGPTGGGGSGHKVTYEGPADAFGAGGSIIVGAAHAAPSTADGVGYIGGYSSFSQLGSSHIYLNAPGGQRGTTLSGGNGYSGGGGPGVSSGDGADGGDAGVNGAGGAMYGTGVLGTGGSGSSGCAGGSGGTGAGSGKGGGGGGGAMAGRISSAEVKAGNGSSPKGGMGGIGFGAGGGGAPDGGVSGAGAHGVVIIEQFGKVP